MPEQMLENRAYSLLAKLPVFEGVFFFLSKKYLCFGNQRLKTFWSLLLHLLCSHLTGRTWCDGAAGTRRISRYKGKYRGYKCIRWFNIQKCLLSTSCYTRNCCRFGNIRGNKPDKNLCPHGTCILRRGYRN